MKPLLLPPKHDPEIHGSDGLGGVEGLPDANDPKVQAFFVFNEDGSHVRAIEGMARCIKETWKGGTGQKVTIVSSGPMTNIALFVSAFPDLLDAVEEFVFMGGAVGTGNRSAVAEYNILIDRASISPFHRPIPKNLCAAHAAHIAINAPIRKTMIPLNVTHTAIATKTIQNQILGGTASPPKGPASRLRHTLSTLVGFFAESYKEVFGFAFLH